VKEMKSVVIIGSSIAGMTTAKIMSEHVDQVYILERNNISELRQPEARKGVPQAKHVHLLLSKGSQIIQEVFPETREQLDELGAFEMDLGDGLRWYQNNRWKCVEKSDVITFSQRRPTLDFVVFNQLKKVSNIVLLEGVIVEDIIYDAKTNTVNGVLYREENSGIVDELFADLVIDCSGRASKTEKWFENHGIGQVETLSIPIKLKYTTRYYKLPDDLTNIRNIVIYPNAPETSRMGLLLRAEDRLIITQVGILGDSAPADTEGFREFAKSLDHPALYNVMEKLEPVSDFMTFHYPASKRKLYNKMKNFPNGFLVMGDAYTSFNPIYGQGMTSASIQAHTMKKILEGKNTDLKKLHKKFYKKSLETINTAWMFATAEDLRYPVEGPRPFMLKILHPFSKMVIETSHNPYVYHEFLKVLNFEVGMFALFKPRFLYNVLKTKFFVKNELSAGIESELVLMEEELAKEKIVAPEILIEA
jgi:2-polyprenyl-6-methoxyphenol hydroxylase-like FAD-dependent oxidoreductase